ncbi:MAG: hypothetical protein ACJA2S_002746 [Cyclobacteriaceae bacterium]|jgi:hypothetical protein
MKTKGEILIEEQYQAMKEALKLEKERVLNLPKMQTPISKASKKRDSLVL